MKLGRSWRDNGAFSALITCEVVRPHTHKVVHDDGVFDYYPVRGFYAGSENVDTVLVQWWSCNVTVDQSRRFTPTLRCGIQKRSGLQQVLYSFGVRMLKHSRPRKDLF